MDFVSQLGNSVTYSLHQATYNPEAEAYSKEQAEKAAAAAAEKKTAEQAAKDAKKAKDAEAKKAADAKAKEERNKFSSIRLLGTILKYTLYAILAIGTIVLGCLGASYSTNLNVYRPWPQRIFYAIYGFLFFIPALFYSVVYRQWMNQHVDPSFGPLPLFDVAEASPTLKSVAPFLLFDGALNKSQIDALREWESPTP
jgi:hypothetical protein